MVSAPEKEGHPLIEEKLKEPGEAVRIESQEQAIEGYLDKIERDPGSEPVTDDSGQVVLTPSGSQQVTITLPLAEDEIKHGLHHKIIDAIYWLAVWCVRIAKKAALAGIRVVYRQQNSNI